MAIVLVAALSMAEAVGATTPTKVGPELDINTSSEQPHSPRVAVDPDGNFIVAWRDAYSVVRARRYFATGNPQGAEFVVSPEGHYAYTSDLGDDDFVSVAADAAGNFVVGWAAVDEESSTTCDEIACIWARRFDASGVSGPSFLVHDPESAVSHPDGDLAGSPELSALGDGNFACAWQGQMLDSYDGVRGRRLASSSQPKGGSFFVSETIGSYQAEGGKLDLSGDAEGSFTVVWDTGEYGVFARRFDDKGKPEGVPFEVSSDGASEAKISMADDGTALVAWYAGELRGQVLDSAGVATGAPFVIDGVGDYAEVADRAVDSFVVVYVDDEIRGRRFDLTGTQIGDEFDVGPTDYYDPDVSADAQGNFVVVWTDQYYDLRAQRFEVAPATPRDLPVFGKSLLIKNKVPEDKEKNKGTWKATGPEIVSPPRGTASDPRCNGDPSGTVKATVRFHSPSSGHDTGLIPLPCQNWFATGTNKISGVAKRGYFYRDGALADGPCHSVRITGTKSLAVSCNGKGAATDFLYDLVPGTGEGTITATLTMGLHTFCSEIPASGAADGSDGKKFKGKNAPPPASCF